MGSESEVSVEPAAQRLHKDLTVWSWLMGVLLLIALAGPFFAGRIYTRDDLGAYHVPVRAFFADRLAHGEAFDWMPQLYAGFYLTGEGQAGTYHPWHLLLYRCLPLRAALAWECLGTYPFLLVGAWLFFRRLFQRGDAAMLGSLIFTFCGFNLLHFVHPNAVAVVAHIPWLLWCIDIVLRDARWTRVIWAQAGIALATGSQLLLGYPQYIWFSLLAETGYALFIISRRCHEPRTGCCQRTGCLDCVGCGTRTWPRLILAKGLGVLLGGVQLWPTLDALRQSTRQAADAAFAQVGSVHPLNLIQLVAPYLFSDRVLGGGTHELSLYVGAVPLMLIAWLVIQRRNLGPLRPLARATAWFGVFALLLAMGQYGFLYRLQTYVPLLNRFRCPCRYLVLFHLAAAVLAAMGFMLLARNYQQSRDGKANRLNPLYPGIHQHTFVPLAKFEGLWAVVVVGGAAALVGLLRQHHTFIGPALNVLAGPVLLIAATLVVMAAARGVRGSLAAVVLLAAVDLGCYGMSYAVYRDTERLENLPLAAAMPPADLGGRVFAPPQPLGDQCKLYTGDQMVMAGWYRADGYAGLEPQRQLDYASLPALQVAATAWVQRDAATAHIPGLVARGDQWLEVPEPLPRIRLVTRAVASRDPGRDIQQIDVRTTALTEYPLDLPPATPGSVEVTTDRPGQLDLVVTTPTRQLLVDSESYHPGWQAVVGGTPRPVLRVNGDFLGCVVGPGKETVSLAFRPESLRWGRLASAAGLGLTGIFLVCGLVRFRRRSKDDIP
jgi:hypothetical protein